jgi:hypothetical protein
VHALGNELHLGTAVFPVTRDKGRLRVATIPGGAPAADVASGRTLRLSWTEGEPKAKREATVAFLRDEAGDAWSWWAAECARFEIDGAELRLFDADVDGRFGDFAADGWSVGGTDQVMPLTKEILLGSTVVTLESVDPGGARLVASTAPLAGTASQVTTLVVLNRFRTANGLPPAVLDPALTAGCTAHAEYLAMNGWTGRTNPHSQALGPRGASPEGAAAAKRSVITLDPPEEAIPSYWRTYYHRVPLVCPWLDRVGINARPTAISVVDVGRGPDGAWGNLDEDVTEAWAEPAMVPADGSVGFPARAGPELPTEPVPGLASRGDPLILVFRGSTEVQAFGGSLEETLPRGAVKVPVLVADPAHHPFSRGLVPEAPLHPATWYRATFTWRQGGILRVRTSRFRTE